MFTEKKSTAEALLPFYHTLKNAWCKESCIPSLRKTGLMEILPKDNVL